MRREGWQHGMVRRPSIQPPPCNPRHNGKTLDISDAPPTAGTCTTKVSSKPTNHSKFSGKCRRVRCQECHSHPISKSRNKAKGTYKLKACDVALNHKLVSWRIVVDKENMVNLGGASASEILSHLSGDCWNKGYEDDDDHCVEDDVEFGHGDSFGEHVGLMIEEEEEEEEEEEAGPSSSSGDEDGGDMGFYVVGLAWEYLDEEDWLVVGEE